MTAPDRVERRLLTIQDLRDLMRCGRTTAYARVHEEGFPVPVVFSDSAHRWWEHEVLAWIEAHRVERAPDSRRHRPAPQPEPHAVEVRRRGTAS